MAVFNAHLDPFECTERQQAAKAATSLKLLWPTLPNPYPFHVTNQQ